MAFSYLLVALVAYFPPTFAFNNPPGVDIWCGKAYRPSNASFEPGGWFEEPAISVEPLLNLKFRPRMHLYLDSDTDGSFLIDAGISNQVGEPYESGNSSGPAILQVSIASNSRVLANTTVVIGSVNNEVNVSFSYFPPSVDPYSITLKGTLGSQAYEASTQLTRLPSRTDGGSVTRLDNLYGGLSVKKGNETGWTLLYPYTYYVQWSLYWFANVSTLDEYAAMGYNVIHIVPTGDLGDTPFPWEEFQPYLDRAAELGLYFQYDVRWEPSNLTTMIDQITRLHSHPSILLWYTGDEPDGKSNPINSTAIAYDTIRSIDPYHPVSLALNCANFYYSDYAAGAEIVLSDVYPISTNTSFSTVYETVCNTTYGCCGCDNCNGTFEDISDRLDDFAHFDDLLGWPKTHWSAPQAFGNETFWTRYPTAAEEVVMNVIAVNHGAKGLVMWNYPAPSDIVDVTNRLATVFAKDEVVGFLLGQPLTQRLGANADRVDAAAWVSESQVFLSIINLNYGDLKGDVTVKLPDDVNAGSISTSLWGDSTWSVQGNTVTTDGLLGLEVALLILDRT